jgi:hypothetical protein
MNSASVHGKRKDQLLSFVSRAKWRLANLLFYCSWTIERSATLVCLPRMRKDKSNRSFRTGNWYLLIGGHWQRKCRLTCSDYCSYSW